jgi:hypothetical protein
MMKYTMSEYRFRILAGVLLLLTLGCDRLVYSQRIEVPFDGRPVVNAGERVLLKDIVIGRVAAVVTSSDRTTVTIDVAPDKLPQRAAFVTTTDQAGRACLKVYSLPADSRDGRSQYIGAKDKAELVARLVQDRVGGAMLDVTDWLLQALSPQAPNR